MTLLAVMLGIGLIIAIYVAIVRQDRIEQLQADLEVANERADRFNASISNHLRESVIYGSEVEKLERRNAYLEKRQYVIMARWWKRRSYRTLKSWEITGVMK